MTDTNSEADKAHAEIDALLKALGELPSWADRLGRGVYLVREKQSNKLFSAIGPIRVEFVHSSNSEVSTEEWITIRDLESDELRDVLVNTLEPVDGLTALGGQFEDEREV